MASVTEDDGATGDCASEDVCSTSDSLTGKEFFVDASPPADVATNGNRHAAEDSEHSDDENFHDAFEDLAVKLACSGVCPTSESSSSDCVARTGEAELTQISDETCTVGDAILTSSNCEDITGNAGLAGYVGETNEATETPIESEPSPVVIDEDNLRELEAQLTEEDKQLRRAEALQLKDLGNSHYNDGRYEAAVIAYSDALTKCLLCHTNDRAVIYSNRAASKMKLGDNENAISDCTKALEFNPDYMKALLRRAELYEKTEKLDEALEDYTKALERDATLHVARAACMRLPEEIKGRNEKLKTEMLGKLKDLGNMILRPFGLSTENFKLQQDPSTGSYSVSFQQNQQQ